MLFGRRPLLIPRRSALAAAVLAAIGTSAQAAEIRFSSGFVYTPEGQQSVDLNLFAKGEYLAPGTYRPDIFVNGEAVPARDIVFRSASEQESARPCLTKAMLQEWGVLVGAYPGLARLESDQCTDISAIPDATMSYDIGKQRLDLSVPQIAMRRTARGSVNPDRWDQGVTAAILDYNLVAANAKSDRHGESSSYLNLRPGFNIGAWRFRNVSSATRDGRGSRWQTVQSYIERDIQPIKGRLTIGDAYTPSTVFESTQFRGLQLTSDDSMLPDSLQGYAPVVRGVAQTHARVEIRQNGYVIYQTVVAPGPFEISDLYPAAGSGDLEVTIVEADGRQTQYRQPFSAVPNMLREGGRRYQFTMGKYRTGLPSTAAPNFVQGTYSIGLAGDVTPYGGFTYANLYQAVAVGMGKNLRRFGGISFDITRSRTHFGRGVTRRGQSYRFLYAKSLVQTGTEMRLVGYRYSTDGYRDFSEAVAGDRDGTARSAAHRKGRFEGSLSQRLGHGSIYATLSHQTYWGRARPERLIQVGYNTSWKDLNLGLYFSQTKGQYSSRQVSLSVSIPLDSFGRKSGNTPSANYMAQSDSRSGFSQQAGVSGTLLEQRNLSYSVYAGTDAKDAGKFSANASYRGDVGNLNLGVSHGSGYSRVSAGVSGGVVIHGGGITFSQPLQDTIALVEVPHAKGVRIQNQVNVRTDRRGYAVQPYATAYRANRIALDTNTLGDDVEISHAVQELVPTRGAVVRARFDVRRGQRMLVTVTRRNGSLLPIGASVQDQSGHEVGVAGTDGQVFLGGVQEGANRFKAQWGEQPDEQCDFSVSSVEVGVRVGYANQKVICEVKRWNMQ